MERLKGKVAIVTGAARGQGAATAKLFLENGATVILTDIRSDDAHSLMSELPSQQTRCHRLDVADEQSWALVVNETVREFKRIDVLVNNAGIVHLAPFLQTTKTDLERLLSVNLFGPFLGMRAVLPHMLTRGAGSIINISSISGLTGMAGMSAYSASKWGLRGITRSAAYEFAARGVRVNSIHPGAIDTPMVNPHGNLDSRAAARQQRIPIGRLGMPSEIAQATLFLASDDASYISGAEIVVDGGWTTALPSEGAVDPNAPP
jgi:3alpha(or 20beta)-hydroxysteroid dehydrogenase